MNDTIAAPKGGTHSRYVVLSLLATGTMINYLDRTVLSIAAPSMASELGLSAATLGIVFSAFSWTYVLAQIPGGVFLDRFGNRITYFCALFFWSIFTALQGTALGLKSLLMFRFGLGISEAPSFPVNSRVVSTWFPQQERARATAIYTVGEYLGLACFSPLLFWVLSHYGWRSLFIGAGLVGIVFTGIWWRSYREPSACTRANAKELEYIAAGGGMQNTQTQQAAPFSWQALVSLLKYRQILGASLGQFAGNSLLIFFLTWFPTYLATERHMAWLKVGFFAVMPFMAAAIGVIFGGYLSDKLLKTTGSANIARKLPIVVGLALASTIISADFVASNVAVIAILSLAFFGQGMVGVGWTLVSDVAPKELMGLTAGLFNFCANLAGILTPLVIGFIISATGSFFYALFYIGAVALIGVFAYVFILGDVKRLEIAPTSLEFA